MLLKFTFKNIGSHQETVIQEDFALDLMFFELLKQILQRYLLGISLDQITVITQSGNYLQNEDLKKNVLEIIEEDQVEFTIVKREDVSGPILTEPLSLPTIEAQEPTIESFDAETSKNATFAEEDLFVEKMYDKQPMEIESKMRVEIERKRKDIDREMVADMEEMGRLMEMKKSLEKGKVSIEEKPTLKTEFDVLEGSGAGFTGEIHVKEEIKTATPPSISSPPLKPAAPSPPSPAPSTVPGSAPFPPPSPASTSISAPKPPAPMPPSPPAGSMGSPPPKMANEDSSARRLRRERAKTEVRATPVARDEDIEEEAEASETLLELKEAPTQEYTKHLSIEYFDRMNPEKHYPLIVDIADVKQALKAAEENIFTGERKVQTQEDMTVVLKSSVVTVEPLFPGCVVTPPAITTDFSLNQDIITFYITPLVSDELKECKIQFLDSERHVIYSIATPTKVDDPRYAKTIATYGTIASILPKALILFGIDVGESTQLIEILPIIQGMFGTMKLTDFIGIAGAIIFVLIGVIVFLKRRPRKVRRSFKVGDIRSTAKSILQEILK